MSSSKDKSRGVALLLSLMLVTLIVLLVLFVAVITTSQLKLAGSSTDSSRAFAAADAGIEWVLSRINLGLAVDGSTGRLCGSGWWPASPGLASRTQYCVTVDNPTKPTRVTAIGRTIDTGIRRSLEVILPVYAAVNVVKTICWQGSGTTITLDAICQSSGDQGRPYLGSTGVYSAGANNSNCTTAKPWGPTGGTELTIGSSELTPSAAWLSARAYLVQCYK